MQLQALRGSTQATTPAIENQTRAIQHSSDILNKNSRKAFKDGTKEHDELTTRSKQYLTNLINSDLVDSSIKKTVSTSSTPKVNSD